MSLHVFTEPHHFTACSHPIVHFTSCSLESSYVKFVIDMRENTPSWRQRFRISRGSVHILQNGTKKCIECLDASHQYTLQSKQIQSLNVFGLHRRKMINEKICFARLWETPPGSSAHSVSKVSKWIQKMWLEDLKEYKLPCCSITLNLCSPDHRLF